jgi:hypothetical protein
MLSLTLVRVLKPITEWPVSASHTCSVKGVLVTRVLQGCYQGVIRV